MFSDKRSKKVVFVAHCMLNQSAMIDGLACYPGVVREVVDTLVASGCGIVQIECPELTHLGLERRVDKESERTIGSEDTRVGMLMQKQPGRLCCRRLAEQVAYQIEQYLQSGFVVAGVLGINGSPTCGVETSWSEDFAVPGPGIFIRELEEAFTCHNLAIPVRGINLEDPAGSVNVVRQIVSDIA
jgi:predicted secreted protein